MAAFAQFGSDLDKATQDKLAQGERLMEALKQDQFSPMPVEEQTAALFAAVNGHLMDSSVEKVSEFLKGLIEYLRRKHSGVLDKIASEKALSTELEHDLSQAVESYRQVKQN
jgi:F-type H+-transporting ATPase subunit alpha